MKEIYYMAIDLKSFYASVECLERGLDIFTTPLVVADTSRGEGSVTLAATPYMKTLGVKARCRVFEIPPAIKKITIFAKPRMKLYVEKSMNIMNVYLDFFAVEDILVYSIDEVFINLTPYIDYYKKTPVAIARMVKERVLSECGIHSSVGVSYSMVMAKLAMDLESKKQKDGIAYWQKEDIEEKLWPVTPLSRMWGIGKNLESRFNYLGLYSVGDIAKADEKTIEKYFGVVGLDIQKHARGIDSTDLAKRNEYVPKDKSIGNGQTLHEDYYGENILLLIRELCDKVSKRLRDESLECQVVHLTVGFSKSHGKGFSKQVKLNRPTDLSSRIYEGCLEIFLREYDDEPVRKVAISVGKLSNSGLVSFDLFGEVEKDEEERNLFRQIDQLQDKFGKNAVLRASSGLDKSTVKYRNKLVGGHNG